MGLFANKKARFNLAWFANVVKISAEIARALFFFFYNISVTSLRVNLRLARIKPI